MSSSITHPPPAPRRRRRPLPRVRPGVLHEGDHDGRAGGDRSSRSYVVCDPDGGRFYRLGPREHAVLVALDGTRTREEVATLGDLTPTALDALLDRLASLGLVDGTAGAPALEVARPARFRADGVTSLRLTLGDPDRVLRRLDAVLAPLTGAGAMLIHAGILVAGLALGLLQLDGLLASALRAPSVEVVAAMIATMAFALVGHEVAHVLTLMRFGGRPGPMGVMLFYGSPALFSDTTDAWRLPGRWQRGAVAAAGAVFQFWLGSLFALAFAVLDGGEGIAPSMHPAYWVQWLALAVLANWLIALANLLPFVRLDGYWMLAAWADEPNLRTKATAYLGRWLGWRLRGGSRPGASRFAAPGWMAFAAASAVGGPLLLLLTLVGHRDRFLLLGTPGDVAWFAASALLAGIPLARVARSTLRGRSRAQESRPQESQPQESQP